MSDYVLSINKEQLASLPTVDFQGRIILIDTAAKAHMALRALAKEKIVGFDTETRPSFRKGRPHKVALMQIATGHECFLFRLNKIGICAELKAFLEDKDITKIGLSIHDDFNAISRSEEIEPGGFIELQSFVHQYRIADISLQKIYAIIFGGRISKGQRLSNWEADTLTELQMVYAALDAYSCLRIYNFLSSGAFNYSESPYKTDPSEPGHIPSMETDVKQEPAPRQ